MFIRDRGRIVSSAVFACLVAASGLAQPRETIKNSDVVEMVRAGLSETVIIQKIGTSAPGFSLTTADLLELKKAGVPDRVIGTMQRAAAPTSAAPPPRENTELQPLRAMMQLPESTRITVATVDRLPQEPHRNLYIPPGTDAAIRDALLGLIKGWNGRFASLGHTLSVTTDLANAQLSLVFLPANQQISSVTESTTTATSRTTTGVAPEIDLERIRTGQLPRIGLTPVPQTDVRSETRAVDRLPIQFYLLRPMDDGFQIIATRLYTSKAGDGSGMAVPGWVTTEIALGTQGLFTAEDGHLLAMERKGLEFLAQLGDRRYDEMMTSEDYIAIPGRFVFDIEGWKQKEDGWYLHLYFCVKRNGKNKSPGHRFVPVNKVYPLREFGFDYDIVCSRSGSAYYLYISRPRDDQAKVIFGGGKMRDAWYRDRLGQ